MTTWRERAMEFIKLTRKDGEKLPPINSWGVSREEVVSSRIMREAERALVLGLSEYTKELLLSVERNNQRNNQNDWFFMRMEVYLAAIDEKKMQTPAALPWEEYTKLSAEAKHLLWYAGIILLRNQLYREALLKGQEHSVESPWESNWVYEASRCGKEVLYEVGEQQVVEELRGVCIPKELAEKANAVTKIWDRWRESKEEGSIEFRLELLRQKSEVEEELFNLKLRHILYRAL